MRIIETGLEGVYIIEPRVFKDARGYFYESWNQKAFEEAGLDYTWVQDNQSKSVYGTVRGIHYQKGDDAQTKLVRALQGRVLDVAVDLRKGSPTYGKHIAVELSEDNHRQLLIPRGFGHGFSVLSDSAVFAYKCDNGYAPKSEGSVRFNDEDLSIDWQIEKDRALLSDKDTKAPSFAEYSQAPDFTYSK
jgi:dTDP-4-dehydrorhamnose 3,5-epimerase